MDQTTMMMKMVEEGHLDIQVEAAEHMCIEKMTYQQQLTTTMMTMMTMKKKKMMNCY
jgi:hypothetical protein